MQGGNPMQTGCNAKPSHFSSVNRRKIAADFAGDRITSTAGGLLLRQGDRAVGLSRRPAQAIPDPRHPSRIAHDQQTMRIQRIAAISGERHKSLRTKEKVVQLPRRTAYRPVGSK
jgi:hypothetical protein